MKVLILLTFAAGFHAFVFPRGVLQRKGTGITGWYFRLLESTSCL